MPQTVFDAYNLFLEGSIVLGEIEANGMAVDEVYLDRAIRRIDAKIKRMDAELRTHDEFKLWQKTYRNQMNIASTVQLGHILFDKLGYKSHHKTPSGRPKTTEAALESVDSPFVKPYFNWKRLKKAKTTYLEGLKRETVNGRIHAFFSLGSSAKEDAEGGARSYRSSCTDPNLQNQPVRNPEISRMVRRTFVPSSRKHRLVEVDYSALEFRIAACFWRDPLMIEYASDPTKDIHRDQASKCYLLAKKQITKDCRYCGKNQFVFPKLYGSWHKPCAKNLWESIDKMNLKTVDGIPLKEHLKSKGIHELGNTDPQDKMPPRPGTFVHHIKKCEDDFEKNFPTFTANRDKWFDDYRATGSFPMMTGFVLHGLFTKNQCMNTPVQGPAFHLLLWSVIQMHKWLKRKEMESKLIAEIHDSALGDVLDDELQVYLNKIRRIMTVDIRKHYDWIVTPLEIEVDVTPLGGSWDQKEPWICGEDGIWQPKAK